MIRVFFVYAMCTKLKKQTSSKARLFILYVYRRHSLGTHSYIYLAQVGLKFTQGSLNAALCVILWGKPGSRYSGKPLIFFYLIFWGLLSSFNKSSASAFLLVGYISSKSINSSYIPCQLLSTACFKNLGVLLREPY